MHYSVLLHPPDHDLPVPAVCQNTSSEDKATNERGTEEEDAFEDALEGVESQGTDPSPPIVQGGGEASEGWMSEAAAIVTTLPSTSTEI